MSEEMLDTVSFPCDPSTLPTRAELPLGQVVLEVKNFGVAYFGEATAEDQAAGRDGHKLSITCQFGLAEPEEMAGTPHTERFFIGTDDDPLAKKPATWKRNAVKMMKLFKEAGVAMQATTKPSEAFAATVGKKVGADVTLRASKKIDPKTGQPYPARINLNFWKVGTKQVHLIESGEELGSSGFAEAPAAPTNLSSSD